MRTDAREITSRRQHGFSLIELMISLLILTIMIGVIVQAINSATSRNTVERSKIDLTQETREFMDQIVNDLDQAGFPGLNMFDPGSGVVADCTVAADYNAACGLISVSSSAIQFEGDVDGSGVSEEWIQLVQTNGSSTACSTLPCVIQRGTVSKAAWANGTGTSPVYYTEVNGVMNTNIFTAYYSDGTLVTLPATHAAGTLGNIAAIGITLYVQSPLADPKTGLFPTVTMVSTAKISNKQNY